MDIVVKLSRREFLKFTTLFSNLHSRSFQNLLLDSQQFRRFPRFYNLLQNPIYRTRFVMDRLLKEREAFKAAAARNLHAVHHESASTSTLNRTSDKKVQKKKNREHDEAMLKHMKSLPSFDYQTGTMSAIRTDTSNAVYFGLIAKIVDFMKKRHLEGQAWSLSLKECLDEMKAGGIAKKTEMWLNEKLPVNPKLQFDSEGKFQFKPPYKLKNDAAIVAQLAKMHRDGKGAILLTELNECFPNAEEKMAKLGDYVITIPCLVNKKKDKAYFFNDSSVGMTVEDDFKSLWRTSNVESLDEKKIEEYLNKHGLSILKDQGVKRMNHGPPKRKAQRKRTNVKIQNVHMPEGLLQNYEVD